MLRYLLISLFCIEVLTVEAQRKSDRVFEPLKAYDFSRGSYLLIFIPEFSQGRDKPAYYTEDKEILNAYKKIWTFDREAITYPFGCLDGYRITLSKDGSPEADFALRFRCQAFVSGRDYWHTSGMQTILLTARMDKAYRTDSLYNDLTEARAALIAAQKNTDVVFIPDLEWEHHDGYFFFNRPNPNFSGRAPYAAWDDVLSEMQDTLSEDYPEDRFDLTLASHGSGPHYEQIVFRVACKKSFFDAFDLYPISSWGWREFKPRLGIWRKNG